LIRRDSPNRFKEIFEAADLMFIRRPIVIGERHEGTVRRGVRSSLAAVSRIVKRIRRTTAVFLLGSKAEEAARYVLGA
jgi:hypothetical protein